MCLVTEQDYLGSILAHNKCLLFYPRVKWTLTKDPDMLNTALRVQSRRAKIPAMLSVGEFEMKGEFCDQKVI